MKRLALTVLALVALVLAAEACAREKTSSPAASASVAAEPASSSSASAAVQDGTTVESKEPAMRLTSSAFREDGSIPSIYTCDGNDTIPPLAFSDVPNAAKSLALIVDDPDVPPPGSGNIWTHWVQFNIPADTAGVTEGTTPPGVEGRNSWGRTGWGGPCPPDREHRYFFRLYALDSMLDLPAGAGKQAVETAMKNHVVARATLMGRYSRRR